MPEHSRRGKPGHRLKPASQQVQNSACVPALAASLAHRRVNACFTQIACGRPQPATWRDVTRIVAIPLSSHVASRAGERTSGRDAAGPHHACGPCAIAGHPQRPPWRGAAAETHADIIGISRRSASPRAHHSGTWPVARPAYIRMVGVRRAQAPSRGAWRPCGSCRPTGMRARAAVRLAFPEAARCPGPRSSHGGDGHRMLLRAGAVSL